MTCSRRLLLNLSKAMLELSLLTRDHFVTWQDDKESSQVKVRPQNPCRPCTSIGHSGRPPCDPNCVLQCCMDCRSVIQTVGLPSALVDVAVFRCAQQAAIGQLHSWLSELAEQEAGYDEDED